MQVPGEHRHAFESFGLEFCPDHPSLGIAGRRVPDDELNRDVTRRDLGEELAIQAKSCACVGCVPDPAERRALEHRDRLVVTGDRHVEYGLRQPGLVPECVVDGLDRHACGRRDGRHGGRRESVLEEQLASGLENGPPIVPGLLLTSAGVIPAAGLDRRRHSIETPKSVRDSSNRIVSQGGVPCPTPCSTTFPQTRRCTGRSTRPSVTRSPKGSSCTSCSRPRADCATSVSGTRSRTGSASATSASSQPSMPCSPPRGSPRCRPPRRYKSSSSSTSGSAPERVTRS